MHQYSLSELENMLSCALADGDARRAAVLSKEITARSYAVFDPDNDDGPFNPTRAGGLYEPLED